MGHLQDLVKLNRLVYGEDDVDFFKQNSMHFYELYRKSDQFVTAVRTGEMKVGGFYFLHYLDDSNWIKYSPIFLADFRKLGNMVVLMCVNFNFIPLPLRVSIFDPYISEDMLEKRNTFLKVKYDAMYRELKKYSVQYSLMEYNAAQVKLVHKIDLSMLPRFLWSQHPMAKYDPAKLLQIWKKKYGEQDARDKEMMSVDLKDFVDFEKEIAEKYDLLKGHVDRFQKSIRKYGGK